MFSLVDYYTAICEELSMTGQVTQSGPITEFDIKSEWMGYQAACKLLDKGDDGSGCRNS